MKAFLVEDERLFADIMVEALAGRQVDVVGRASNEPEALAALDRCAPDIAVLDIRLPPTFADEGIRLAELIRKRHPSVGILVLSSWAEVRYAERLLRMEDSSRSVGYLLKERVADLDRLVDGMRRVVAGEVAIDSYLIDRLLTRRSGGPIDSLTPHERRVLALVAEGRSNLGVAQALDCRVSSVEKHLSVVTDKLGLPGSGDPGRAGVNVRVSAVLRYLEQAGGQSL